MPACLCVGQQEYHCQLDQAKSGLIRSFHGQASGEKYKSSVGVYPLQGRNGAVCVIALAERGALFDPGPCMYMEKLAVGPAVDPRAVGLNKSIAENLAAVAEALNKPIG